MSLFSVFISHAYTPTPLASSTWHGCLESFPMHTHAHARTYARTHTHTHTKRTLHCDRSRWAASTPFASPSGAQSRSAASKASTLSVCPFFIPPLFPTVLTRAAHLTHSCSHFFASALCTSPQHKSDLPVWSLSIQVWFLVSTPSIATRAHTHMDTPTTLLLFHAQLHGRGRPGTMPSTRLYATTLDGRHCPSATRATAG